MKKFFLLNFSRFGWKVLQPQFPNFARMDAEKLKPRIVAEVAHFLLVGPGASQVTRLPSSCGQPATHRAFLASLLTFLSLAPPSWHPGACRFVSKIVSKTLSLPPEDAGLSGKPAPGACSRCRLSPTLGKGADERRPRRDVRLLPLLSQTESEPLLLAFPLARERARSPAWLGHVT